MIILNQKNKKQLLSAILLLLAVTGLAQTTKISINTFLLTGPYAIAEPYKSDTVDVNAKAYDNKSQFDGLSLSSSSMGKIWTGKVLPSLLNCSSIGMLTFYLQGEEYAKGSFSIKGLKNYKLYVDGKEMNASNLNFEPCKHTINIKYISAPKAHDTLNVSFESKSSFIISTDCKHRYNIHDGMDGKRIYNAELSPNGKYAIISYVNVENGGNTSRTDVLKQLSNGKTILEKKGMKWLHCSDECVYEEIVNDKRCLSAFNLQTGVIRSIATDIPQGFYTISPSDDYLIYNSKETGPKEKPEIFQVLEPEDRQNGWRDRSYISIYDLKTGMKRRLTFGLRSAYSVDVSKDGKTILFVVSHSRLTKRPTSVTNLYSMDIATMKVDTIFEDAEFMQDFYLSPDKKELLIKAGAEEFGGIGLKIKEGQSSNEVDSQLFMYDLNTRKVTPLTKNFNPSVDKCSWSKLDGQIYFTAADKDYVRLYSMNPSTGKIKQLNVTEDVVSYFSLADNVQSMLYFGQSVSNSIRMYQYNLKNNRQICVDDCSKTILKDVELGECKDWNFLSSRGDTIYGRYYLPPHFEASKKYPLIVYYYGGCAPTDRLLEFRYPPHAYSALDYVVYVVQPSGAIGFGQEFSARHVNSWGQMVADDIIEGTKKFCSEHTFINAKKVGCLGASYGGFMTQYLQTVTDIFAAAVSHAGISNITSYWGEGYWGYSYGEVASAGKYPWNARDMYTKQSPLFNADKIHTPLLFLHGTDDTNVPIGESIQMFTALKLLGRETALVEVQGENHHIMDYNKRILWQNTIFAWFAKWLKDDASWWNTLYPPKNI
jgi:dipeptidyl aminopeptidase/acylaminoacyl peptidase